MRLAHSLPRNGKLILITALIYCAVHPVWPCFVYLFTSVLHGSPAWMKKKKHAAVIDVPLHFVNVPSHQNLFNFSIFKIDFLFLRFEMVIKTKVRRKKLEEKKKRSMETSVFRSSSSARRWQWKINICSRSPITCFDTLLFPTSLVALMDVRDSAFEWPKERKKEKEITTKPT